MTGLPAWLAAYAALDDEALAALANRGLARRGAKEAVRFQLVEADEARVLLTYTGMPGAQVTLVAGGPRLATCGCPVAGVCVHVVAACVWARTAIPPPVERVETSVRPVELVETNTPPVQLGETNTPPVELVELNTPPVELFETNIPPVETKAPETPDVLAELLALDPAKVNRSAGIAAVRKVAAAPPDAGTTIAVRPGTLRIGWPGSPAIVAVAGGGFGGMLVAGQHSDVAERAWRLEALVRVFAANNRAWTWPRQADAADVVHPGQNEAMQQAIESIEGLLRGGLSRLGADGSARLAAAAQRARLEALPLLGTLLTQAAGRASGVASRSDDASERDLLQVLARAWTLATALRSAQAPLPIHLVGAGRAPGEPVEVGVLVPLAVRWWLAASGARGLTLTLWDSTHGRLETVTTGRAAGTDPSFERSWTTPMMWGVSASTLAGGPFTLTGAERRDDGSLSPTSRTRVTLHARFTEAPLDLADIASAVSQAGSGAQALGFLPPPAQVRVVLPRKLFGLGRPELDEVNQELVWPVTDRAGVRHPTRVDATGTEQDVIGWLLTDGVPINALVLDQGNRPIGLFVTHQGKQRLIAPTLTPTERGVRRGWLARLPQPEQPRAHVGVEVAPAGPFTQACAAVLDVCEALASTGRPALSVRQRDTLTARAQQASDIGLLSLSAAVKQLLAEPLTPPAVLRATLLAERVRLLSRGS